MGGRSQLAASRRPEGLSGLILVAPAQPTPRRNPEEMRQGQLHAYDNREILPKTIGSGRLTARPPSPAILEQIVEDSMSGSHEATMAYPIESILEDISGRGREYQRSNGAARWRVRSGRFNRTTQDRSPSLPSERRVQDHQGERPLDPD